MKYSSSTCGFYHSAINGDNIPLDAVEITAEHHAALLAGQSAGQRIIADASGYPMLADYPAPTDEHLASRVRADRNTRLASCDWAMLSDSPLDETQRAAWVAYRQLLREVPQQAEFPASVIWPEQPA